MNCSMIAAPSVYPVLHIFFEINVSWKKTKTQASSSQLAILAICSLTSTGGSAWTDLGSLLPLFFPDSGSQQFAVEMWKWGTTQGWKHTKIRYTQFQGLRSPLPNMSLLFHTVC